MNQLVLAKCIAGAMGSLLVVGIMMNCSSSPTDPIGGSGSTPGGGGLGNTSGLFKLDGSPSSGGGTAGSVGPAPTGDANCGVQTNSTTKAATDVLLVLDRSGSMGESISEDCCCEDACVQMSGKSKCSDTTGCVQRWPSLTTAVNATLSQTTGITWGLKFFSTPPAAGKQQTNECAMNGTMEVPIGTASAPSAIQAAIAAVTPGAATPTAAAIDAAVAYLKTVKDQNNRVILLATDGEPNCRNGSSRNTDVPGTQTAIENAQKAGFKVYVIGIGPSVGNLDNFAQAGGTEKYFPATSAGDLANALATISKAVASCNFNMTAAPPDPANVAVYLDGNLLPSGDWGFGTTNQTVTLNGSACDKIMSGAATTVQVYFGCPGTVPPPILR